MTIRDPKLFERDEKGQLKKGSGGRPVGAKSKLPQVVVADVLQHWNEGGKAAMQITFIEKPDVYLRVVIGIVANLIPKELIMTQGDVLDTLSDDDVLDALKAVREERARASYDS